MDETSSQDRINGFVEAAPAERNERPMWVRLKAAQLDGDLPVTHAGVLGQVWREGPLQARLSQALDGIDVRPLDEQMGRKAGQLLGAAGMSDVVDAAVILLAEHGDEVVTFDHDDLEQLATAIRTTHRADSPLNQMQILQRPQTFDPIDEVSCMEE